MSSYRILLGAPTATEVLEDLEDLQFSIEHHEHSPRHWVISEVRQLSGSGEPSSDLALAGASYSPIRTQSREEPENSSKDGFTSWSRLPRNENEISGTGPCFPGSHWETLSRQVSTEAPPPPSLLAPDAYRVASRRISDLYKDVIFDDVAGDASLDLSPHPEGRFPTLSRVLS